VPDLAERDLLATPEAGRTAVRGGVLRVLGYALGVLLTVGSAAVLFRHLGVEDSGRYVLVLGLVTLFGGVTDAGLSTIAIRELSSVPGVARTALLRNLLGLRIVFTIGGALLAVAYAAAAGWGTTLVAGTALAGAGLLLTNVQGSFATGLIADLRLGWVTFVDGVRQAVTAAGIVALALVGASLLPFFTVVLVAALVALVLTAWLVRGSVPLTPALDRAACRALLREALPFALAAAVGAIYFRLALVLVDGLSNDTETGYFSASFRVVEVLLVVPQLAVQTAFPIFARAAAGDHQRLRYGLGKTLDVALLLGMLVAVGLGIGAPFVIEVVAGKEFAPAADVLRVQSLAFVGSFAGAVFGYALLSLHRNRAVLIMNGAALVSMVVLGGILVPLYGAEGAAVATVACETIFAVVGGVLLARSGAVGRPSLDILPRLLAAAAAGTGVALLSGLPALPASIVALLVASAVAVAIRAVPEELLVELRAARLKRS
jgi:O-antigen/teichoic acid export membrane protein